MVFNFRDDGLKFGDDGLEIKIQFQGSGTAFSMENGQVKSVMANSLIFLSFLDFVHLFAFKLSLQLKFEINQ